MNGAVTTAPRRVRGDPMCDDEGPTHDIDGMLDAIRSDWRRLGASTNPFQQRRIRRDMQARFEDLERQLAGDPQS